MGNRGIRTKMDKYNPKFLGDGEYLQFYFNKIMTGTSQEKFQILKDIVDSNPEIADLLELPNTHEEMNEQNGFFLTLPKDQSEKLYNAFKALQEKE